jgi:serine protease Do
MAIRFLDGKTKKIRTSLLATAAAASLLLISGPGMTRAQAPVPGFPPPQGFGGFMRPPEAGAGWLGVSISELTAEKAKELKLPDARGVAIDQVGENAPAAKSGLKKGDVVTEYNGQRVEGALEFERLVRETPPNHTAKLSIWRDGRSQSISVVMGDAAEAHNGAQNAFWFNRRPPASAGFPMPDLRAPGASPNPQRQRGFEDREPTPSLGVGAQDLSGQLGNYFGVPDGQGVLVTDVHAGSAGEKAGLKAGDVITKLDGERVHNVEELRTQLRAKHDAATVTLGVFRKGNEVSLTAAPEKPQARRSGNGDRLIPL